MCFWRGASSLHTPFALMFLSELSHVTSHPDPFMLSGTFHIFYKLSRLLCTVFFAWVMSLFAFSTADVDCELLCEMFSECSN